MIRLLSCLFIALSFSPENAAAQQARKRVPTLEAGFLVGFTNYSGDVAEHNIEPAENRFGYGAYARYYFTPKIAAKAHFYSGTITGDDINNDADLRPRQFRFASSLYEIGAVGEWHILGQHRISSTGVFRFAVTPFLFGGLAYVYSNAETECYGTPDECEKYLREQFPEPSRKTIYLTTPVGAGIRFDPAERLVICTEMGWRPVFSDKLDGISINGNPKKRDWYYFYGVTLAYVLNDPYRFQRRGWRK